MYRRQYRQGDVLVSQVKSPREIEEFDNAKATRKRVIGRGEKAGHSHKVAPTDASSKISLREDANGTLYLRVSAGTATVSHPEHKPLKVAKGDYTIHQQREAAEDESYRQVID